MKNRLTLYYQTCILYEIEMKYYELRPEENHFYSVGVDITHRCNMECANCYIPNRDVPDMDVDRLIDCISRFPFRTEIRLIGAEPTVREDLSEIIQRVRATGHRPVIMTNGLKLGNRRYAQSLYDAGLKTVNISLNGGDDDSIYEITDELRCADRKMKALKNCADIGFFINTNTLMMRGVNDNVPKRLIEICKELGINPVHRFRNIGQIGRYTREKEDNWSFEELINHLAVITHKDPIEVSKRTLINGYDEERSILYPLDESKKNKTAWIKITDWSPAGFDIPDPNSKRRGRITQDFNVAPFFEHVKINEFGY